MMFRLAYRQWLLLLCSALAAAPAISQEQKSEIKPSKGRSIEFSESGGSGSATNLPQLQDQSERLKLLEKDLTTKERFNPFENFNPNSSLDGVSIKPFYMPSAPSIQSKKLKELLDRRKNWVFMTTEDFAAEPTTAEIFNLPEYDEAGQEKKEETSLDRFYRSLQSKGKQGLGQGKEKKGKSKDLSRNLKKDGNHRENMDVVSEDEEHEELRSLHESEQALKKIFEMRKEEKQGLAPFLKPETSSDPFGLSSTTPVMERTPAQKARMEEFKSLVGPLSAPASGSSLEPLKPFSITPSSSMSPTLGGGAMESPLGRSMAPSQGLGAFSPSIPTGVGRSGGIIVNPLEAGQRPIGSLTPTRIEPGKVNATPIFSTPQRKF